MVGGGCCNDRRKPEAPRRNLHCGVSCELPGERLLSPGTVASGRLGASGAGSTAGNTRAHDGWRAELARLLQPRPGETTLVAVLTLRKRMCGRTNERNKPPNALLRRSFRNASTEMPTNSAPSTTSVAISRLVNHAAVTRPKVRLAAP